MSHLKRLLVILALFALCAWPMAVIPIPDFTGDGNIHQFSSTIVGELCIWVQVNCTGTGTVRLGSSTVAPAANVGVPCAAGGSQFYPVVPVTPGVHNRYDLSKLLFLAPIGTTVSITYAQ